LATLALIAGACTDDDAVDTAGAEDTVTTEVAAVTTSVSTSEGAAGETTAAPTTTEASGEVLRILVTDDDGIAADGLDAMVEALRALPDTEVTVIAPAENQSGTGSKTTEGALTVTDATTKSGFPSKAVAGFPADTVIYALDQGGLAERPHVVLSGINQGANIGPLTNISGTIGAAKAAAVRGVPALAASQGLATVPDYPSGVKYVLDWVARHRSDLLAGTKAPTVDSLNIPTCPTGAIRGQVEVPTAADAGGRELFTSNCASSSAAPVDDVDAFSNGFVSLSDVPAA